MAFASGKTSYGISDRSGFRYRLRDMKKEWTGALVGPDEFEEKHPQLNPPRHRADPQALRNPRPDPEAGHVYVPVGNNVFPPVNPAGPMLASVGTVAVSTNIISGGVTVFAAGLVSSGNVGSVSVVIEAVTFDSTAETIDSTVQTFDEV